MFGLNDGDPKQWFVTIFIIGEKLKGSTFLFAWQLTTSPKSWHEISHETLMRTTCLW